MIKKMHSCQPMTPSMKEKMLFDTKKGIKIGRVTVSDIRSNRDRTIAIEYNNFHLGYKH